ncbi:MAG: Mrp/NBP35 family ATP-binding protein [Eubacteriaceae bacterium]|nr:Mrp/NBP35 family ATP-binding protein [Eubacteriaceae bacterium]MBR0384645.1 Mrp/NBP35 family ATP-binding protein [Eubacteriaceae bacterium]
MSEKCTSDCGSCGKDCADRTKPQSFQVAPNPNSHVKKVIGVISGKGGVGKSTVTAELAVAFRRRGLQVGIMDADITGPSMPKAFGLTEMAVGTGQGLYPVKTKTGIDVMSMNLLLEDATDPVVWRGPVIAGAVKQFWSDVIWEYEDVLLVDMPPGTGDVPLTVFQSLPVDGIIIVTSPQDLVTLIVEKAAKMAKMMNVPVLGIVENYSYLTCPDCGKKIPVFGESKIDAVAADFDMKVLGKLPLNPKVAALMDAGAIEDIDDADLHLDEAVAAADVQSSAESLV